MKLKPAAAAAAAAVAPAATDADASLPEALGQAIGLLRAERIDEAEPALMAILQRHPGHADALHYLGVLRHTQGRTDEAVTLIRQALAREPEYPSAWSNLGNVLLLAGRFDEAAEAYEHSVQAAGAPPESAPALNNLATLHRHRGRLGDSELAARRAVELVPDFADAWYNLSLTLIAQGRINDGLKADSRARALWPAERQPRHELIRALLLLDERERAAKMLRDWLTEEPGNPVAEHMLAACEGRTTPERASDDYVRQVFDAFAASFDAKLEGLGYSAPARVVEALAAVAGPPAVAALDIVDAGCGTGLCGPGLRPYARRLVGCDLSEGMLRRAQARQVYDALHAAELTHYLATQPGAFDAVVSADTLCYFGALEAALAAAHASLREGGRLVFTVEALPDDAVEPHRLQSNGRYAHAAAYLRVCMAGAGFDEVTLVPTQLRMEAGEPVRGLVVQGRRG